MRPRGPVLVESLAVRVTEELAARLDAYVARMQKRLGEDFEVQRADALREILEGKLLGKRPGKVPAPWEVLESRLRRRR